MLVFDTEKLNFRVLPIFYTIRTNLKESAEIINEIAMTTSLDNRDFFSISNDIYEVQRKIENVKVWLEEGIDSLKNAENSNISITDDLVESVPIMTPAEIEAWARENPGQSKIDDDELERISNKIKNETPWIDNTELKEYDGTGISMDSYEYYKSTKGLFWGSISYAWDTTTERVSYAWDCACEFTEEAVSYAWTEVIRPGLASAANGVVSVAGGVADVGESFVDGVLILGSAVGTIGTAISDAITGGNATEKMWKWTMNRVAYDAVGNACDQIFNALDGYAFPIFKSDGVICTFAWGLGEIGGIIAIGKFFGGGAMGFAVAGFAVEFGKSIR